MDANKIILLSVIIILLSTGSYSVTDTEAQDAIGNASERIDELRQDEIPVQRLEDLLADANQTFNARKKLENPSYDRVAELTSRIRELSDKAVRANDEIEVLKDEIEAAEKENVNTTEARSFLEDAEKDLESGRYDQSLNKVDSAYESLSDARAVSVRLETFYQEETENILNYVRNNFEKLSVYFLVGFTGFLVFLRELRLFRLRRLKKKLENKQNSVEKLIVDLERKYYEKQEVPKKAFEARKEKFQEIMEDTRNRIPEIEDEIERKYALQKIFLE